MEVRNRDMSWPEEILCLEKRKNLTIKCKESLQHQTISSIIQYPGTSGVMNIGNTCYISAAFQTLSNIKPLTETFIGDKRFFF